MLCGRPDTRGSWFDTELTSRLTASALSGPSPHHLLVVFLKSGAAKRKTSHRRFPATYVLAPPPTAIDLACQPRGQRTPKPANAHPPHPRTAQSLQLPPGNSIRAVHAGAPSPD